MRGRNKLMNATEVDPVQIMITIFFEFSKYFLLICQLIHTTHRSRIHQTVTSENVFIYNECLRRTRCFDDFIFFLNAKRQILTNELPFCRATCIRL